MRAGASVCMALWAVGSILAGCVYDDGRATQTIERFVRMTEPKDAEFLYESGNFSLFAGKTKEDKAYDAKMRNSGLDLFARRSLFMRRRTESGKDEWRVIMTAEGDWKLADCMSEWCEARAKEARSEFDVMAASLSRDGRTVWMICNPHTSTYCIVCSLELATKKFRVLIDGDSVSEQADGTIFVGGKKTYLSDANGEPLGAAWYDLWMTPEGKVVRKTKPITMAEMEKEWEANKQIEATK